MGYLQPRLQQDHLYNKIDWAIFSLPRYLARVGPLYYFILSGNTGFFKQLDLAITSLLLIDDTRENRLDNIGNQVYMDLVETRNR